MRIIFIVARQSGDYEDFREQPLKAFSAEKDAEDFKNFCEAEIERVKGNAEKYPDKFDAWGYRNPLPKSKRFQSNADREANMHDATYCSYELELVG